MSPGVKRPAEGQAPDEPPAAKARQDEGQDFASTDPLYALLGECADDRVCDEDGNLREETMMRYLDTLMVQKAAKKPKDWIEVWAAMLIPIESQSKVLEPIMRFGLENAPEGLGAILAHLIMGHRCKTKAVDDAVQNTFQGNEDPHGVLREMLYLLFPRGPDSEWGWSRVGWSWQEWWKIACSTMGCLAPAAAFDSLAALLDKIEANSGGKSLKAQTMLWNEKRLTLVKEQLCKYGDLKDQADLVACLDATIS
mmetsp:Transcript_58297/g.125246  ORF Transcript_58297/g.125246 Transcript_58297/m.125246 type:complete len:253 (+) Transcript_58297:84-842(+)